MKIIGCEFHPRWQQVAVFDAETGEVEEYKLTNGDGQAERFYRELAVPALSGMPTATDSGFRTIFLIEGAHEGLRGARKATGLLYRRLHKGPAAQ